MEGPIFSSVEGALVQLRWGAAPQQGAAATTRNKRMLEGGVNQECGSSLRATIVRWRVDNGGPTVQDVSVDGIGNVNYGGATLDPIAAGKFQDDDLQMMRSFVLLRARVSDTSLQRDTLEASSSPSRLWLCGIKVQTACIHEIIAGSLRRRWRCEVSLSQPLGVELHSGAMGG